MLSPFAAPARDDAFELTLRLGPVDPEIRPELRRVWHGRLTDGPVLSYHGDATRRMLLLEGLARLDVDFSRRRADLVVAAGQEALVAHCLHVPMLCVLLPAAGQYPVHAAAMARDADGSAFLLAGLSGRGKTTSALALARAGLRLMTDDTCFVMDRPDTSRDGELGLWGLRRQCRVRHGTFDLLPWLGELPRWPALAGQPFQVELGDLWPASAALSRPAAIFLLDEPNPRGHVLAPVEKILACQELMRQNLHVVDPSADGTGGSAMRMITRLAAQCLTWRLSVGPDLGSLRDAVEHAR